MNEMVNAANQIAEAMSDFVGNKQSVLGKVRLSESCTLYFVGQTRLFYYIFKINVLNNCDIQ